MNKKALSLLQEEGELETSKREVEKAQRSCGCWNVVIGNEK